MRYRPFGRSGVAVSALSLTLNGADDRRKASDWLALVHAALEHGVNAFEIAQPSSALLTGFAQGIEAVRRPLLFVSLRSDPQMQGRRLDGWVSEVIAAGGFGEVNLFTIAADSPEFEEALGAGLRLRDLNLVRRLAVAGPCALLETHIEDPLFDALVIPFGMLSGWRERNLVRVALARQMGVMSYDPCPAQLTEMAKEERKQAKKSGWFKRADPLATAGSHTFLQSTPGWTPEQICLAYALTEPAVTTVQMPVKDLEHLAGLAAVPERNLPAQVAAQIEMSHFTGERTARTRASDKRRA
jgi:aryl-alcohol dehydrogenase-like predicted oxidoreductase